jgi:two-component system, NtrC family, response regulator GlrR
MRCALINMADTSAIARSTLDTLRTTVDLEVDEFPLMQNWNVASRVDALILVVAGNAIDLAYDSVARFSGHVPIIAVGRDLGSMQIVRLFAEGAVDFVSIPISDSEFVARLKRVLGQMPLRSRKDADPSLDARMRDFVGKSPAFLRQINKLPVLARCDSGVLILGETGTGKEICAQAIHYLSARASRPWVAVNCGAIPVELVENELFGHVRGAYTTANTARDGLVFEAERGTLFLDDIDCLPLTAQAKLLRFLEEYEYRPVGGNQVRRADVRVIAAGNHRLEAMVENGQFRQDLYFRLNVLTLELPPLRERREDVPLLARYFLRVFSERFKRPTLGFSPGGLAKLLAHDWPGNVRELQHVIERAVLLASCTILDSDDIDIRGHCESVALVESFGEAKARTVQKFERNFIERLLLAHDGNVSHAARKAKKNRRAFFQLIRKHGIDPSHFRAVEK